mmetsp:Transcript_14920/g.24793  ORF Transcript_14920/g.24793 Transcript_14920/m.24793 type:complete len:93 (-) Transcript_14920:154-432(-)
MVRQFNNGRQQLRHPLKRNQSMYYKQLIVKSKKVEHVNFAFGYGSAPLKRRWFWRRTVIDHAMNGYSFCSCTVVQILCLTLVQTKTCTKENP